MTITKEETVLRRWEYASIKRKKQKTNYSLVVTNKRIVSETKSTSLTVREEIPISSVKSLAVRREVKSIKQIFKVIGIVFLVVSIIAAAVAIFGIISSIPSIISLIAKGEWNALLRELTEELVSLWFGLLAFLISALFKFIAKKVKDKVDFFLVLTTYGVEGQSLQIGMTSILKRLFHRRVKGKMKIKVSDSVTKEIIEIIGALIVDNR